MNEFLMMDRGSSEPIAGRHSIKISMEEIKSQLAETCLMLDEILRGLQFDETREDPFKMETQCMQQDVNMTNMLAMRCMKKTARIKEILF